MNQFQAVEERWLAVLGQVRDVVRQTLLAEQLRLLLSGRSAPARVLDVGCGQGTQAIQLARRGHDVVGLDTSQDLLDRCRAELATQPDDVRRRVTLVRGAGEAAPQVTDGDFDLVLCHGVLMYLDRDEEMLAALAAVLAETGSVSVLVRNALGLALRPGLLARWDEVGQALETPTYTNRLGLHCRAHSPADLDRGFAQLGLERRAWWGVRVFTDHLSGPAPTGQELAGMLDAELQVSGLDPYRQVAALSHLVYRRGAAPGVPATS